MAEVGKIHSPEESGSDFENGTYSKFYLGDKKKKKSSLE